jgi:hypothetical protein
MFLISFKPPYCRNANCSQAGDTTGKGKSCDDEEPDLGCIYSQGLLVLDASQDEVSSAVADVAQTFTGTGGIFASDLVDLASFSVASVTGTVDLSTIVKGGAAAGGAAATDAAAATTAAAVAASSADDCFEDEPTAAPVETAATSQTLVTKTVAAGATDVASAALTSVDAVQTTAAAAADSGENIQAFTGTLGGTAPPVISSTGDRPFEVNGDTFVGSGAALGRSCDVQHNACANAANSGQLAGGVAQCEEQSTECKAANNLKKV